MSKIEWTDITVNPLKARNRETGKVGHFCIKISPGCAHCYSSTFQKRFGTFPFVAENRDKVELFLDETVLQRVLRMRKPKKLFWFSMTDPFWEGYPDEWIDRCFAVMALTPHLTHQVLTKRAERMYEYFDEDPVELKYRWGAEAGCLLDGDWIWNEGKPLRRKIERFISLSHGMDPDTDEMLEDEGVWIPLPNVHLGVSVENQEAANERIPWLMKTPAAMRFISYEPALGPIDWALAASSGQWQYCCRGDDCDCRGLPINETLFWDDIHQIICGGESGPGARPCDLAWIRSVRDQCRKASVPLFVKQLGSNPHDRTAHVGYGPGVADGTYNIRWTLKSSKGSDLSEWPEDLRVREFPDAR